MFLLSHNQYIIKIIPQIKNNGKMLFLHMTSISFHHLNSHLTQRWARALEPLSVLTVKGCSRYRKQFSVCLCFILLQAQIWNSRVFLQFAGKWNWRIGSKGHIWYHTSQRSRLCGRHVTKKRTPSTEEGRTCSTEVTADSVIRSRCKQCNLVNLIVW